MYVMKFYDELLSSDLENIKAPEGAWVPVYIKDPGDSDPPVLGALEISGVQVTKTDKVLWALAGDFVKKYIEPYGDPVKFPMVIDGRPYQFAYMVPPGRYVFGTPRTNIMILEENMIIGHHESGPELDQTIEDFGKIGFPEVRLKLGHV